MEHKLPLQLFFARVEVQTVKFHTGQNSIQTRRKFRWAGHVARMGEEMGCIGALGEETGGKETTGEI